MPEKYVLSRRLILKMGGLLGCSCLFPISALAAAGNYTRANKDKLLGEFVPISQGFAQYIIQSGQFGSRQADEIGVQARLAFERLLASVPDIGGESNRNQGYLIKAAWMIALYQAGRQRGMKPRQIGWFYYDANQRELGAMPREVLAQRGDFVFSQQNYDDLARWSSWSKKRLYPGDWVGEVMFGTGEDFDMGYDYLECGAVKLFKAHNVFELAPYFCLNDFPRSGYEGTGLVRTGTLAMGMSRCDFRYKRGRPVTQSWDSELTRLPAVFAR